MEPTLDYASKSTGSRLSRLAIVALILGILSGPIAYGLIYMVAPFIIAKWPRLNKHDYDYIGMSIWLAILVPACVICSAAMIHVKQSKGHLRGRMIAIVGLLACVAWVLWLLLLLLSVW